MKHVVIAIAAALVLVAGLASGEETRAPAKPATPGNVVTLRITTVYGQRQRPAAAIEVARARMTLPPTTPTLSGLAKIQDTTKKEPF